MMKHQQAKGYFITLEGGEGSGKSSLLRYLCSRLETLGFSVVSTREPGGTVLGETVRNWLLQKNDELKLSSQAELLLFLAARAQHIQEVILPALEAGKVVICDRFNDSTIAYQGAARGLGIEHVSNLCGLVCGKVQPNLTLYLDVSVQTGLNRSKNMQKTHAKPGELDRIESENLAFHQLIRDAFEMLCQANFDRIIKIDANQSQESVQIKSMKIIQERLL